MKRENWRSEWFAFVLNGALVIDNDSNNGNDDDDAVECD